MSLELKGLQKRVGADMHIHDTSLVFEDGSFNILLGATRSGKTTLMQLMAGIQPPTRGEIWHQGRNVTGVSVQRRNVSMVYQQFVNYPMLSVYENIASPLRVTGVAESEIKSRVGKAAEILRLTPMLNRKPSELSGGQQQRTAIARAIVKDSDVIFLDEPLANLDYKLREELRDELPRMLSGRNAIVFYATTEPHEALLFGGNTATLHEGQVTQFGKTAHVYRNPNSLLSARVFSDPPINMARVQKKGHSLSVFNGVSWPLTAQQATLPDGAYDIGIRPHHVMTAKTVATSGTITGRVLVTEISGSESVIHIDVGGQTWVSQSHGVHPQKIGEAATLHADVSQALFFAEDGRLVT
jgi:glycerol transport system ATP-binding protein